MNKALIIFSVLFTLICAQNLYAQKFTKTHKKAEKLLRKGEYTQALEYFNTLNKEEFEKDSLYHYYMGIFHFHSPNQKKEGIEHFEQYLSQGDSIVIRRGHAHIYYMVAKLNHLSESFDVAEDYYNQFIVALHADKEIPEIDKNELIAIAQREIERCKFGRAAIKNPRKVIIENLGDSVNTINPEYAAVVSQDEKQLFFTSRRPETKGGKKDENGYFEDIYSVNMTKGSLFDFSGKDSLEVQGYYFNLVTDFEYADFQPLNKEVNGKKHDGSIQLDANDSVLYFYRDFDVWFVPVKESGGAVAKKMGSHVNSLYYEPSIFFSYDGTKLFIVSDRPGGFGGLDIYVSYLEKDSTWSTPVNLGPNVNTAYDEDAPYLDPNGRTFYFSSKGHSSMGEYDIFRSTMRDSTFSVPVNLGYPINTPAEDIYFTMTKRYNRGYYSSDNLRGNGDMDIYRITFADERDPVAELKGLVKKGDKLVPAKSNITLISSDTSEYLTTTSDPLKGDYFMLVGHGKEYSMIVETEGFAPYFHGFKIPEQKEYFQLYQEVHHVYLYNSSGDTIGQKITIYNALGEVADSSTQYFNYSDDVLLRLKNLGYELDYDGLITVNTDVKFYMTYDSLAALMNSDKDLSLLFPENATISYLKEDSLFMLLNDSYESGELPGKDSDILANTNYAPMDSTMARDLYFAVQVGYYSSDISMSTFPKFDFEIRKEILPERMFRYSFGRFAHKDSAQIHSDDAVSKGVLDAFVSAYYDGERISAETASALLQKYGPGILAADIRPKEIEKD